MSEDKITIANAILFEIEQAKLTDSEAEKLPIGDTQLEMFEFLADILNLRGAEGLAIKKLNATALLNGVDFEAKKDFKSNVFIGAVLE